MCATWVGLSLNRKYRMRLKFVAKDKHFCQGVSDEE
jgi:hypothetical protein